MNSPPVPALKRSMWKQMRISTACASMYAQRAEGLVLGLQQVCLPLDDIRIEGIIGDVVPSGPRTPVGKRASSCYGPARGDPIDYSSPRRTRCSLARGHRNSLQYRSRFSGDPGSGDSDVLVADVTGWC